MDVGILSFALQEMTRAVATGFGLLGPDVRELFRLAMGLAYSLALVLWLWEGRPAVHGPLLRMLLKFAAIGWLLEWFPEGSQRLMLAAAEQGRALVPAGGFSLDDPGYVAFLGIQAISPLLLRAKEMLGPVDFFLNFVEIALFLLSALVVLVAFCVLAIQVFLAFLEWRVLSLAAYLAIPFAVLGPASFVAERSIGYVAASALRLLVLGLIVALGGGVLMTISFTGEPTLAQALGVAVLSVAILVLALKAPRAAAGLVNGGPVLDGVTAMAGLYTATRLGVQVASGGIGLAAAGLETARRGLRTVALPSGAGTGMTAGAAASGAAASAAGTGRHYPAGRYQPSASTWQGAPPAGTPPAPPASGQPPQDPGARQPGTQRPGRRAGEGD
jgi:type IV secretion system protein TrbL